MTDLQIVIGIVAWLSAAIVTWSFVYVSTNVGIPVNRVVRNIVRISMITLVVIVIYFGIDTVVMLTDK